jgi:hypothetical protein
MKGSTFVPDWGFRNHKVPNERQNQNPFPSLAPLQRTNLSHKESTFLHVKHYDLKCILWSIGKKGSTFWPDWGFPNQEVPNKRQHQNTFPSLAPLQRTNLSHRESTFLHVKHYILWSIGMKGSTFLPYWGFRNHQVPNQLQHKSPFPSLAPLQRTNLSHRESTTGQATR